MSSDDHTKLPRLYIPEPDFSVNKSCALSEGQAHYLRNVMRKNSGDMLRVFNGQDGEWLATLQQINKNKAIAELSQKLREQECSSDIWVLASPVKKDDFDLMVEKACELGASRFIPIICDHSVVHNINQERLQNIAIEAAEQSERLDVMNVSPLAKLKNLLKTDSSGRTLIFCLERADAEPIAATAKKLAGQPITLLIGPSGGFSSQEIEYITSLQNTHTVSLGPRILKSETALISALACMQFLSLART